MAEQSKIDKITDSMMEYTCDYLCRFPKDIKNQEELDNICDECKMGKHVCDILNTYNRDKQE